MLPHTDPRYAYRTSRHDGRKRIADPPLPLRVLSILKQVVYRCASFVMNTPVQIFSTPLSSLLRSTRERRYTGRHRTNGRVSGFVRLKGRCHGAIFRSGRALPIMTIVAIGSVAAPRPALEKAGLNISSRTRLLRAGGAAGNQPDTDSELDSGHI